MQLDRKRIVLAGTGAPLFSAPQASQPRAEIARRKSAAEARSKSDSELTDRADLTQEALLSRAPS